MKNEFLKKEIEEVEKEIERLSEGGLVITSPEKRKAQTKLQTLKECQFKEKEKHKKFVEKLKEFLRGYTPNYNYVCEQIDKFSENLE